eukprot:5370868-Prymnesium_polylepis.1
MHVPDNTRVKVRIVAVAMRSPSSAAVVRAGCRPPEQPPYAPCIDTGLCAMISDMEQSSIARSTRSAESRENYHTAFPVSDFPGHAGGGAGSCG